VAPNSELRTVTRTTPFFGVQKIPDMLPFRRVPLLQRHLFDLGLTRPAKRASFVWNACRLICSITRPALPLAVLYRSNASRRLWRSRRKAHSAVPFTTKRWCNPYAVAGQSITASPSTTSTVVPLVTGHFDCKPQVFSESRAYERKKSRPLLLPMDCGTKCERRRYRLNVVGRFV
jgi:hypothetical protein